MSDLFKVNNVTITAFVPLCIYRTAKYNFCNLYT